MYAIKAKIGSHVMRDVETGKMRQIGPYRWELFEALPPGMAPADSPTSYVREVKDERDLAVIEADNSRTDADWRRINGLPPSDTVDAGESKDDEPKKRRGK